MHEVSCLLIMSQGYREGLRCRGITTSAFFELCHYWAKSVKALELDNLLPDRLVLAVLTELRQRSLTSGKAWFIVS